MNTSLIQTTLKMGLLLTALAPTALAAKVSDDTMEEPPIASESESKDTPWVARGSVGRLFFIGNDSFSNALRSTTTIRLETGRTFGPWTVGLLGQISHIDGQHWEVQLGPDVNQGDSLFFQLGVSGRFEGDLGPLVGALYGDVTATRIPLLMNRNWYEQDVVSSWGKPSDLHENEGQFFKHAGLGFGGSLAIPISHTGLSAEAQAGVTWITGLGAGIQTQIGMKAVF